MRLLARRHGAIEITADMIDQLREKIGSGATATAAKAKRGLNAAMGLPAEPVTRAARVEVASEVRGATKSPRFPGFALRSGRGRAGAVGPPRS